MIYPTRPSHREWFIRETIEDIKNDSRAAGDLRDDVTGGNNTDGFTVGDNGQVRLGVAAQSDLRDVSNTKLDHSTAKGRGYAFTTHDWDMKGLECTARIKCTDFDTNDGRFIIKGPTGSHKSNTTDCSGSSYGCRFFLAPSGGDSHTTEYHKEQWHVKYVSRGKKDTGLSHLHNKWVVLKYIIYIIKSTDGQQQWVKIESWININNDGVTFKKVNETVDKGGWGNAAGECGADRGDEIMTWDNARILFRWDGPKILFKDLSVREIDPTKLAGEVGEPPQPPTTGTISREWSFKNNIITFTQDECSLGQDTTNLVPFYDVDDNNSASNLHKERYRVGVVANGSRSTIIGRKPKRVIVKLSKTGSPPAGEITCVMRKGSDDTVAVTYAWTGGTLNATALTTTKTEYTFENLTNNYAWQNGDRLLIEYSGNTVDVTNEVNVYRNTENPFDSIYTCAIKFDVGGIPPTAYSAPDLHRDYAWRIYDDISSD